MTLAAQKTELFVYDEDSSEVVKIGCPTSVSGAGSTNESIEVTCLDDDTRHYMKGLTTPGEVSFDIRFDTANDSHMTLKDLHKSGDTVPFAIAFSDGDVAPTYDSGAWDFTDSGQDPVRSSITFKGFLTTFEFSFEQNDAVGASIGIQISGHPEVEAKA